MTSREPLPPMPLSPPMAALQAQLNEWQWWPPQRLLEHQMGALGRLLHHAWDHIPFYRARLEAAGWAPWRAVTPGDWSKLPVLTRAELQQHGPALRSPVLPKEHGQAREVRSSGSTGMPVVAQVTSRTHFLWRALALRNQLWQRRDFALMFATIRRMKDGAALYPEGERLERWAGTAMLPFPTGPAMLLNIATPIDRQAEWLQRHRFGYLLTAPSNLAGLAELGQAGRLPMPALRQIATVGEVTPPELRVAVREAWGVGLSNDYSAEEVGYIALQCPDHEHMHVQAETALVEVVDDEGRACGPGAVGRVLVTPLFNYAQPLLRYQIGDLAEVGPPCPCGRGLPVLTRVMGRVRNTLITPDGGRYWPSFGMRRTAAFATIRQHQFIQRSLERIEARLVVDQALTAEQEATFRGHVRARLPCPFEVDIVYVEAIPRSAGGKFEDFQSDVAVGHGRRATSSA